MSPAKAAENGKKDARSLVSWVALAAALALAIAVGVFVSQVVSGDSRDDVLEQSIRDVKAARQAGLHAVAQQALIGCSRNNFQDATLAALLRGSVASRAVEVENRTRVPLTAKERALLKGIYKRLSIRDCLKQPTVMVAFKQGAITRKEAQAVLTQENRRAPPPRRR